MLVTILMKIILYFVERKIDKIYFVPIVAVYNESLLEHMFEE